MITTPRVSVVIPVFNGAHFIGRALASVFSQTYDDYEIIIVDDGSTDDLQGALTSFDSQRILLIRQETNSGAASARNAGVRAARGEYIAFLDCDDEWLPEKLSCQLASLEGQPSSTGVSVAGFYLERDRLGRRETRLMPPEQDWFKHLLGGCDINAGSGLIVRREVFEQHGYYDETMRRMEDWDWLLRYVATGSIITVARPLAIYHSGLSWPSPEMVDRALRQIESHHRQTVQAHSNAAWRILHSTMFYERASAHYHSGNIFDAFRLTLIAVALNPMRGLNFYCHVVRRSVDALRGRIG